MPGRSFQRATRSRPFGVVEIEPPHDGEAVGIFPHRFDGQFVRVGVPQHRVDQRPVHTGLIHGGDRLLRGVRLLTMWWGRRTFFPEMNLAIDDSIWCILFIRRYSAAPEYPDR